MNPITSADLDAARRLIQRRVPAGEQQDWLEMLGLEPYEAPGYNPESTTRNGGATRTRTTVRSGP